MSLWQQLRRFFRNETLPVHLVRGQLGEAIARRRLQQEGLEFLTANYRSRRGEIDLVMKDGDCLVFVEVKTRSSEAWVRPAAAVNFKKRRRITLTALDYLRALRYPWIKVRFDVVEVLLYKGRKAEVRHLPNIFTMTPPHRYD